MRYDKVQDSKTTSITYSGKPRFEIFQAISKQYKLSLTNYDFKKISELMFEKIQQTLPAMTIFKDAERFLESLISPKKGFIFISSSVPQQELEFIVKNKLPPTIFPYLSGIFGSAPNFTKGIKHIEKIKAVTLEPNNNIIMFGDDLADCELSLLAGVDCVLLNREGNFSTNNFPNNISSFDNLRLP